MKLLEMILDMRMCDRVEHELGEEQMGFRKVRGTHCWVVLTRATSREEIGEARKHGFGFCGNRKSL